MNVGETIPLFMHLKGLKNLKMRKSKQKRHPAVAATPGYCYCETSAE
jgi:hypothetical protein